MTWMRSALPATGKTYTTCVDYPDVRIGDVAAVAGMSVSALRAWEERYGVLRPQRTEGGHRIYGEDDLRRVLAVQALVADGATVASAAARVAHVPGRSPASPPPVPAGPFTEETMRAALAAARTLLRSTRPKEAAAALMRFVEEAGGSVVPAAEAGTGPEVIPIDLAFGTGPPVAAVADPLSVERLQLEQMLPTLAEDARHVVMQLRRRRADR